MPAKYATQITICTVTIKKHQHYKTKQLDIKNKTTCYKKLHKNHTNIRKGNGVRLNKIEPVSLSVRWQIVQNYKGMDYFKEGKMI